MKNLTLMPAEFILKSFKSATQTITLTTQRLVQEDDGFGVQTMCSIPVHNIDTVEIVSKQDLWKLIAGIFGGIGISFSSKGRPEILIIGLTLSAAFIVWWWLSRMVGGLVYSMSGKTIFYAAIGDSKEVGEFIGAVQIAVQSARNLTLPSAAATKAIPEKT